MAEWPSGFRFVTAGFNESFEPSVLRTEMERGVPKMRNINTHVMASVSGSVLFETKADIADFDTWYFNTIKRIRWFDFKHPRTGATIQARVKELGPLEPVVNGFAIASRSIEVEYLR